MKNLMFQPNAQSSFFKQTSSSIQFKLRLGFFNTSNALINRKNMMGCKPEQIIYSSLNDRKDDSEIQKFSFIEKKL